MNVTAPTATPYFPLSLVDLAMCCAMMGFIALIAWQGKYDITKTMLWGALRAGVQLLAVGYALMWLFSVDYFAIVFAVLMMQSFVAAWQASRRQKVKIANLPLYLWIAIVGSSFVFLFFAIVFVIHPDPLWKGRIVIPIAGMVVGNALNAAALSVDRLVAELRSRRDQVEAALAFGASPWDASLEPRRDSLHAAVAPSMNQMFVVGIVQLPGMMTGQIIGGVPPTEAVRYQILIMYLITAACFGTAWIVERLIWRKVGAAAGVWLDEQT